MSYTLDPTGQALQNKVIGETKPLSRLSTHNYLIVTPDFGPFLGESLVIKHTSPAGVSRILSPEVDYSCGFQFVDATSKSNRAFFGCINFVDITLTGSVVYNYQTLGGSYLLAPAGVSAIQSLEVRDPQFTTWEQVLTARTLPYPVFPVVDHPWSSVNVDAVKRATDELEQVGLTVHLRPAFLPTPEEVKFIPSAEEVGLGNVDNFKTATTGDAVEGSANNLFMTPAATKASVKNHVNNQLALVGYKMPVGYEAGISVISTQQTFSYHNNVYAARPQCVPFVTNGAFERDKFILINSNDRDYWSKVVVTVTGAEEKLPTGALTFETGVHLTSQVDTHLTLNSVIDLVFGIDYHLDDGVLSVEYPLESDDELVLYMKPRESRMANDKNYYKTFVVTSGSKKFKLPELGYINPNDLRLTLNDFIILLKDVDYLIDEDILTISYVLKLGDLIEVENIDLVPFLGKQQMRAILFSSNQQSASP